MIVEMKDTGLKSHLQVMVDFQRSFHETQKTSAPGMYLCLEDFVLKNAKVFTSEKLSPEEVSILERAAAACNYDFPQKYCFHNSLQLVAADKTGTLKYVEGFATGLIPIHHGWVSLNGKVVDVTLQYQEKAPGLPPFHPKFPLRVVGEFTPPREYLGVEFDRKETLRFYREELRSPSPCMSMIDNWSRGWPLLRTGKLFPKKK